MTAPIEERPTLPATLAFLRSVWAVSHALDRRSKWMAGRHGVTGPQRLAMRILAHLPGISAGELADLMCLHPSTLTGILRKLVERHLVARTLDSSDARRSLLVLTKAGKKVGSETAGTVEDCVGRVLETKSPDEIRAAETFLRELADALAEGLDP